MNNIRQTIRSIQSNILTLGSQRIAALAIALLALLAIAGGSAYLLSRPNVELLYSNLERADIGRIGGVLRDQGIQFDVSATGAAIYVPIGETARARMLLAENGLPTTSGNGYELFDKMGSLGMTSFMQEVTRLRAIEGELARTIQIIRGVRAARVHLVLGEEGSFRRARQAASASVIVRTEQAIESKFASAIRHLVSAAVPGMKPDAVTIIHSDGTVLATQDDETQLASSRVRSLEKSVASDISENVRRTLAPYLSIQNFQVSVAVRLNTDRRQVTETIFDPNTRVERSVKVTRENQTATNASQQNAVTVERNIPTEPGRSGAPARQSNEESQRREEVTNYEMSSKTIQSISGGYSLDNISIALLVNRSSLATGNKSGSSSGEADIISEIEAVVASAAGLRKERGDVLKVSAVEFSQAARDIEPVKSAGLVEHLFKNSASLINATTILLVSGLVIALVIRPALAFIAKPQNSPSIYEPSSPAVLLESQQSDASSASADTSNEVINLGDPHSHSKLRVAELIQKDEERATAVLRDWLKSERVTDEHTPSS